MNLKPCEYCGCDLPMGVDKNTRRLRSFHFERCEVRLAQKAECDDALADTTEPYWIAVARASEACAKSPAVSPQQARDLCAAIDRLHDAIMGPAPTREPVAFMWQHEETGRVTFTSLDDSHPGKRWHRVPLYTTPPCEPVRLTEDGITDIWNEHMVWGDPKRGGFADFLSAVRAVEDAVLKANGLGERDA